MKEKYVTMYRYDCKVPDCPDPKGAYDSDKDHAWKMFLSHLFVLHFEQMIIARKFKRVK